MIKHDKCAAFEKEIETLKARIEELSKENLNMKLCLSGLLMRSESLDANDRQVVMSAEVEDQINNILKSGGTK